MVGRRWPEPDAVPRDLWQLIFFATCLSTQKHGLGVRGFPRRWDLAQKGSGWNIALTSMSGCDLRRGSWDFMGLAAPGGHWPGYLAVLQLCVGCDRTVRVMMLGVAARTTRSHHAGYEESGIV